MHFLKCTHSISILLTVHTSMHYLNYMSVSLSTCLQGHVLPDDFGAGSRPPTALKHSLHSGFCPILDLTGHRSGDSVLTPVPKNRQKTTLENKILHNNTNNSGL